VFLALVARFLRVRPLLYSSIISMSLMKYYLFFSVSLVMALLIDSAILQALAHSSQRPHLIFSAFIVPAVREHLCGVRSR